jgi:hypothetical protein
LFYAPREDTHNVTDTLSLCYFRIRIVGTILIETRIALSETEMQLPMSISIKIFFIILFLLASCFFYQSLKNTNIHDNLPFINTMRLAERIDFRM